jgi:hypothetical protein
MIQQLEEIGFRYINGTLTFTHENFKIEIGKDGSYFWLYVFPCGDEDGAVYEFKTVDKLLQLIEANIKYFE